MKSYFCSNTEIAFFLCNIFYACSFSSINLTAKLKENINIFENLKRIHENKNYKIFLDILKNKKSKVLNS